MENYKCPGFKAAGCAAGIKKNNEMDLGILFSEIPATVAGVFTQNKVPAAPVLFDMEQIKSTTCQAIIVNSGNANCCTGKQGLKDADSMANLAAAGLNISKQMVMVASTGVIGKPLPIEKIEAAIPALLNSMRSDGIVDLAGAIMTTDTVPKIVVRKGTLEGKTYTVTGVAKGAGMICPNMATMLCFIGTDIIISPERLQKAIATAVDQSFNRITIDGDTSTNDTVLILANGLSGAVVENKDQENSFQNILNDVVICLAKKIVKDGEGATKLVEIIVRGALSDHDARKIANTVANSNLVKTAFFGEDANWGRIIGAVGYSGVPIKPYRIDIFFDNVLMVKDGIGCGERAETEATKVLKKPEYAVVIDLKLGHGFASVLTCDFSIDYVRINADYRS